MDRKKRNLMLVLTGVSVFFSGMIYYGFGAIENPKTSLNLSDVEAITSCEITKNGGKTIMLLCTGEKDLCQTSKWGSTLTCSGKKVVPED